MRTFLFALALVMVPQALADSPARKTQVFVEVTFIAPGARDHLVSLDKDLDHVIMDDIPMRLTRTPKITPDQLIDPKVRIHSSAKILTPDGEPAELRTGGHDTSLHLKIVASIVNGSGISLSIDQNVMRFGCTGTVPCSSMVKVVLQDERTAVIDGILNDGEGTHPYQMLVTPHIVRSRADMERLNQQKVIRQGAPT